MIFPDFVDALEAWTWFSGAYRIDCDEMQVQFLAMWELFRAHHKIPADQAMPSTYWDMLVCTGWLYGRASIMQALRWSTVHDEDDEEEIEPWMAEDRNPDSWRR